MHCARTTEKQFDPWDIAPMRWLLALLCLPMTLAAYANTNATTTAEALNVDKVLVVKSER
jgi:hypothetical protein